MKRQAVAVVMVLAGCSHSPLAPSGAEPLSSWYDAGVLDARHGRVVKDNDTLAEWYGNPQVDREDYLRGYLAGQKKFCSLNGFARQGWPENGFLPVVTVCREPFSSVTAGNPVQMSGHTAPPCLSISA